MIHASRLIPQGRGLAPVLLKRAGTVSLDWDVRQKSRFDVVDSAGRQLGIFLARGTVVRGGDVLVAEDGSLLRVVAAPQPVLHISHCPQHGSAFDLIRAAYHLGNRHVPIELKPDHLKIEPDHVLADMLRAMHLIVREETSAFEPENGAYSAQADAHGHAHGHDAHDHAAHDRDHATNGHAHSNTQASGKEAKSQTHTHDDGHHHEPEPTSHDGHTH
jgi:urease accessory protein